MVRPSRAADGLVRFIRLVLGMGLCVLSGSCWEWACVVRPAGVGDRPVWLVGWLLEATCRIGVHTTSCRWPHLVSVFFDTLQRLKGNGECGDIIVPEIYVSWGCRKMEFVSVSFDILKMLEGNLVRANII